MAKQQIRQYVFTPGAAGVGTIEIPGKWDLNQLTLITNVTQNAIIFNFADPSYNNTTVTFNRGNTTNFPTIAMAEDGTTTIKLGYSTTGQLSTDQIQIFVERLETITRPWAMGTDAFERTRVAAPSSMIDSDFEYGMQPTKWQTISMVKGIPSVYEVPGSDLALNSITTDASNLGSVTIESLITVTSTNPHLLTTGSAITVQNLDNTVSGYARAQGIFVVNSVTNSTVFSYYAKAQVGSSIGQNLLSGGTVVRKGGFYTNSGQTPTYSVSGSGAATTGTATLTFVNNHGFFPGDSIFNIITSDNGSNNHALLTGPAVILSVPTPTTFTFNARNVGTITGTPLGTIYARSDAFYQHRPLDGGVMLGAGGPNYGSHAIRMSKKYIRYQSGKAVNYNTGAQFAPSYYLQTVTATNTLVGSTVYVTTDDIDHGLQAGATIMLNGITGATGYAGTYTVASIVSERQFTFSSTQVLSTTTPVLSTPSSMNHVNWTGATVRAGTFDDQNGMYWQYDGQFMAVGRRSSTFQIAGVVNATPGSNLITGVNTRFNQQIIAGDRVVLKGMSHLVTAVSSSSWVYVNPPYRGSTATTGAKMTRTIEINVPQSQWNMDRCDGSNGPFNPSGYNLLPYKMQMIGMQWTWYGAGFIDWMLRGPQGNYITVHRMKNSNINDEAYQRSGNMPVRYEVQNEGWHTDLAGVGISNTDTVMTVTDVTYFATTGTVMVDNELINYTGKTSGTPTTNYLGQVITPGTLTGLTRNGTLRYFYNGSNLVLTAGSAASHAASTGTGVIAVGVTATPTMSHWGSAFMTDGGFNDDVGYIFNYNAINVNISTIKQTAFAIRLAPSVSNAVTGDLGVRDLVNRAQMKLQALEITAGGSSNVNSAIIVEGVINPGNYPNTVTNITWYNLQGTVQAGNPLGTGQPSFAQVAPAGYIRYDSTLSYTTTVSSSGIGINSGTYAIPVASTASIAVGDAVVAQIGGTSLTAGNSVIVQTSGTWIILNNALISRVPDTTPLTFYRNTWAQPGETIFSFISSPSNKDSIDLTGLKELTNTPLGGRGTYPNGPDTLFINVYLTQGTPINAQLVLRWAEPQA
jgi:hypothetical protein